MRKNKLAVMALSAAMAVTMAAPAPAAETDRIAQLESEVAALAERVTVLEELLNTGSEEGSAEQDEVISLISADPTEPSESAGAQAADMVSDTQVTGGIAITVTGVRQASTIRTMWESDEPAEAGYVYFIIEADFENVTSEMISLNAFLNRADSYADGYTVTFDTMNSTLNSELMPGRKTKGTLIYVLPEDWQTFEFCFRLGFAATETVMWTYTPSDVSM